eukprot:TRINITY_DN22330_c0_g1_i1.p1 TRINITY_DN22330_c0_g1~~TRINITY_DN22330_c0_g1_i1.p1  ORF type:complete len:1145 (+),score=368.57 TRINITY_DN22330_c0_g1_i1:173-3607(+)
MLPFEGIKTRQAVDNHPESCRVRPHDVTWGGSSAGGAVSVVRPRSVKKKMAQQAAVSPQHSQTGGAGAKRAVLLPMGPAVHTMSPRAEPPRLSPVPGEVCSTAPGEDSTLQPVTSLVALSSQLPIPPHAMDLIPAREGGVATSPFKCVSPSSRRRIEEFSAAPRALLSPSPRAGYISPQKEPRRQGSVSLNQLAPPVPDVETARRRLKKLDVSVPIPDRHPGAACLTPRFKCAKNIDCTQGAGLQTMLGFATNPDEGSEGVDQSLCYHVEVQNDEYFLQQPVVDQAGTLSFVPSTTRHGVAKCSMMVVDHSCIKDGDFKKSKWTGFTITVQAAPPTKSRTRDWRAFHNKMNAPIGLVPDEAGGAVAPPSPRQVCSSPTKNPEHAFPPVDLHSLRIQTEQKWGRHPAFLLSKASIPTHILSLVTELELLRGQHSRKDSDRLLQERLRQIHKKLGGEEGWEALQSECAQIIACKVDPAKGPPPILLEGKEFRSDEMHLLGGLSTELAKLNFSKGELLAAHSCWSVSVCVYESLLGADKHPPGSDAWKELLCDVIEDTNVLVSSLTHHGVCSKHVGELDTAIGIFKTAVHIVSAMVSRRPESVEYLVSLYLQLGEVLFMKGHYSHVLKIVAEVKQLQTAADDQLGNVLFLEAVALAWSGAYSQAQTAFKHVQQLRTQLHGADSLSVVEVLFARIRCFDMHGKAEQCFKTAQEAVDVFQQGPSATGHTTVYKIMYIFALQLLGYTYAARGKYSLALPLFEKACEKCSVLQAHIMTTTGEREWLSRIGGLILGVFHCSQKRYPTSLTIVEDSFVKLANLVGRTHYVTALTEVMYACILYHSEDYTRALEHALHGQYVLCRLAQSHEVLTYVNEILGDICFALDQHGQAIAAYTSAFEGVCRLPGAERELRLRHSMSLLCRVYCKASVEPPTELVTQFTDLLGQQQKVLGEWDIGICPYLQCVGELYYASSDFDRAERTLTKMLKISDTQNLLFLLGNLFKPAAQLADQQVSERNRLAAEKIPSGAPSFAVVLLQLAAVQEANKAWADAEASYLQARAAFEIANLPNHPGVTASINGIGRILYNSGMYGDALSYFQKTVEVAQDYNDTHRGNLEQAQLCIRIVNKKLQSLKYLLERYEVPGGDIPFPVYI